MKIKVHDSEKKAYMYFLIQPIPLQAIMHTCMSDL